MFPLGSGNDSVPHWGQNIAQGRIKHYLALLGQNDTEVVLLCIFFRFYEHV